MKNSHYSWIICSLGDKKPHISEKEFSLKYKELSQI